MTVSSEETEEDTQTQRRSHVETEAETLARGHWSPWSGKRQQGPSLEPEEGAGPWDTWISHICCPGWEVMTVCALKAPTLWGLVLEPQKKTRAQRQGLTPFHAAAQ